MTRSPRVLFVDQYGDVGGGQRILLGILRRAAERKWPLAIAVPTTGPLAEEAADVGVRVFPLIVPLLKKGTKGLRDLIKLSGSLFAVSRPLAAAVRDFAPDVIYVNGGRVLLQAILAASGRPLVFHMHSSYDHLGTRLLVRWALRSQAVKLVLTPSDFMTGWLQAHLALSESRIRTVHNWVGDSLFEADARDLASELGWPRDRPIVGVAGRVAKNKGQLLAIAATRLLRNVGMDVGLVIAGPIDAAAGGRNYLREMQSAALPLGEDFKYLGSLDKVAPFLAGLSVALVPSTLQESFGLAAAEAMAAETCVVVTPSGALPEVVADAGVVAEHPTAEALAESLSGLLADPEKRKRHARAGRERASRLFSYAKQTDTILEIIEEVASGAR